MIFSPPAIIRPHLIHIQATYYTQEGLCKNGQTTAQNRRKYGLCAAYNRAEMNTRGMT